MGKLRKKENKNDESDGRAMEYRKEHVDIAIIFIKVKAKVKF